MRFIFPPSDEGMRDSDTPTERLRKRIHRIADKALKPEGPVLHSKEQILRAFSHVNQLIQQETEQLPEEEVQRLALALLSGIKEKTHPIRIRFISQN